MGFSGDREIEVRVAEEVDLAIYKKLCEGSGKFDGDECPECGGEGEMQGHFADYVEVGQYKTVKGPLCNGKGRYDGDDCPECPAEGEMPRYAAEQVDVNQYKKVKCPLCNGEGRYDGDDCPECGGEGEMQQNFIERSVILSAGAVLNGYRWVRLSCRPDLPILE